MSSGDTRERKPTARPTLHDLENVAEGLAIPVHYEPGEMRGGLCRVRGERQIIINADLPADEKVDLLAESLAAVDLDAVYMAPRVRAFLERIRDERA
jgi:hypothetical protein